MAKHAGTDVTDLMKQTRSLLAMNPMIAPQMEQFWKAQDRLLDEAETFATHWFERRHEATKTALEAVRKAGGDGSDPSAAMRALVEWQQKSIQRLAADMQDWGDLCSRCAGSVASGATKAQEDAVEEVERTATSATGSADATPV